jgi:hypothetical protein
MPAERHHDARLADLQVERQCAWCLLIVDAQGVYSIPSGRTIRSATHGICPTCKASVKAEFTGCLSRGPNRLLAA